MDFTLIDTHSHLYLEHFKDDLAETIARAKDAGLAAVLLPAIDRAGFQDMMDAAERFPGFLFPMIGVHPTSIKEDYRDELDFVAARLQTGQFCGIGEIGIDMYWDKTYLKEQKEAFSAQIDLANQYNLPFVIHARDSFPEVFDVLDSKKQSFSGIFHAFSGSADEAFRAIGLGFKLGIGGVVTYKKSHLPEVIRKVGLEHLVLETDAPYLTPAPHRGKRNESAYVQLIAEFIAAVLAIPVELVAKKTTGNALELFRQVNQTHPRHDRD